MLYYIILYFIISYYIILYIIISYYILLVSKCYLYNASLWINLEQFESPDSLKLTAFAIPSEHISISTNNILW